MKRDFVVVLAILFLVVSTGVVRAEEDVYSPRPAAFQRLQNVRQEAKEKDATRAADRNERLTELRKSIVTNFFTIMVDRLQTATNRLDKILVRIESRVAKIKSENPSKDLTVINSEVSDVKAALADVQVKIDALKSSFGTAIVSDSPKGDFKKILSSVSSIKKDLQNIKKSLSKIIGDIKGLHVGDIESSKP